MVQDFAIWLPIHNDDSLVVKVVYHYTLHMQHDFEIDGE